MSPELAEALAAAANARLETQRRALQHRAMTPLALADKIEQATEPTIELSHDIARALGWKQSTEQWRQEWWCRPGTQEWQRGVPNWVWSIDAALTLLKPDDFWSVASTGSALVAIKDGAPIEGRANSPVLALVAAILRARAAHPPAGHADDPHE